MLHKENGGKYVYEKVGRQMINKNNHETKKLLLEVKKLSSMVQKLVPGVKIKKNCSKVSVWGPKLSNIFIKLVH